MKIAVGWAIAAVAGLVLLAACGGGGGEGTTPPADEAATPEVTAEVEEEGPPDRSDVSFVANLLAKEEAGEWTRGEGLVATLKLFAGELDAANVLRHPDLIRNEGTGIFKMAHEYLDGGPDAEAQAEISRLLDFLVFSNDQLEAMAGLSPPTAGLPGQLALGAARGPEEDCSNFFYPSIYGPPPAGVGQCLEVKSTTIDGELYRVFFPSPAVAGWTEEHADLALEAMEETAATFNGLWEAPLRGVNLVLSVSATPGGASASPKLGEPCGLVLYTDQQGLTKGDRKQFIAHELAHCFQTENFSAQDSVGYEFTEWREEGLAEYMSNIVNVAYAKNNLEWDWLGKLAGEELTTTLFDRSYENFIWFQHLGNSIGDGVFAVVQGLPASGGRSGQEAGLAGYPGMAKIYHDFAEKMADKNAIEDTGGGMITYEGESKLVQITAPATPLVQKEFKPFGVARRRLLVQEGKLACLDLNAKGVRESARPTDDETEWSHLPPTLPEDSGDEGDRILVVTTTEPDREFTLDAYVVKDLDADAEEELPCACIVGTWVVDNDDVRKIHEANLGEAADTVSVNGKVTATYEDGGVDPDTLEATGAVTFEFDGWELRSTKETPSEAVEFFEGWVYWSEFQDLDVEVVTRSEGTARGGYVANGSQLELGVGDFETTVTITASLGREGGTTSALPDLARVYVIPGVVTYQCSDDRLAIPWEQGETVEWTRVQ